MTRDLPSNVINQIIKNSQTKTHINGNWFLNENINSFHGFMTIFVRWFFTFIVAQFLENELASWNHIVSFWRMKTVKSVMMNFFRGKWCNRKSVKIFFCHFWRGENFCFRGESTVLLQDGWYQCHDCFEFLTADSFLPVALNSDRWFDVRFEKFLGIWKLIDWNEWF